MLSGLLVALVAFWMVLSIAAQAPKLEKIRMSRWHFGLIPNWYLFTTRWARVDLELQVRSGESPWSTIPVAGGKSWHTFVWHPRRRLQHAFVEMVDGLIRLRLAGLRDRAPETAAYQYLQRHAASHSPGTEFQFRIVSHAAAAVAPSILFVSGTHTR
ncbi:MAG: hypothetical protein R2729_26190 [Bryobacteraceae bacterium]